MEMYETCVPCFYLQHSHNISLYNDFKKSPERIESSDQRQITVKPRYRENDNVKTERKRHVPALSEEYKSPRNILRAPKHILSLTARQDPVLLTTTTHTKISGVVNWTDRSIVLKEKNALTNEVHVMPVSSTDFPHCIHMTFRDTRKSFGY